MPILAMDKEKLDNHNLTTMPLLLYRRASNLCATYAVSFVRFVLILNPVWICRAQGFLRRPQQSDENSWAKQRKDFVQFAPRNFKEI